MSAVQVNITATAEDRVRAVVRGEWLHVYIGTVMLSMMLAQGEEAHAAIGKALLNPLPLTGYGPKHLADEAGTS